MAQIANGGVPFWNDGEKKFERNALVEWKTRPGVKEEDILPLLVKGEDLKPGMVVRSYDNVMILSDEYDGVFGNGGKVTIMSTESFIEGEVQDSSEEEGWRASCITIAADYGGHPQLGRGSKIDRLYLGENNQNAKLYYPPKDYLYVVMWSPEGINGYPYPDANQNGGFDVIRFGKAPEDGGEQE
tara:strand:- start:11473 stop:12027 length:555 start_codon:yes stop_codon:yes gene_type:complete